MDGADDIVEVAPLQQIRHAVLHAGDEVGLDPEPQVGALAYELAVGVDVVDREFAPQRVLPHAERLLEAVDVLGDAQLGDPVLVGDGAIAGDVLLGEVGLGAGVQVVLAKVQVIVGEHGVSTFLTFVYYGMSVYTFVILREVCFVSELCAFRREPIPRIDDCAPSTKIEH